MEEAEKPQSVVQSSNEDKVKKKGKNSIPAKEVIDAVSPLGDRITQLDTDGNWRSDTSLWSETATQLANKLSIKNTLNLRKYIYSMWHRKTSNVRSHFIPHTDDDNHDDAAANLESLSSIPSYTKIETRSQAATSSNNNNQENEFTQSHLIEFSYDEWRKIYKKGGTASDSHQMDPEWTSVFYDKLIKSKLVTCSIAFGKSRLRKKNSRKRNKPLFICFGRCQNKICPLTVQMETDRPMVSGQNVVFRVKIEGTPRHDDTTTARPLKGVKRKEMAEAAIQNGILATYEHNLVHADDDLLQQKNHTEVPNVDVIKTAVKEKKCTLYLDTNILTEVEILLKGYMGSDNKSSEKNKGFIHTLQIWPFSTIFYTEPQLIRFIKYCKSTPDSYVYVDATGSVAKAPPDQKKPFLYLICFKDGEDPSNLLPLAGSLLTDHTTASINNWLLSIRQAISHANKKFVQPTFIVIDFSPALLNAILLSFNQTNIHAYLRWCFNVIRKRYTFEQLNLVSCIRFCNAHVMHAFTRSLSKIKLTKNIRGKAITLFAILLLGNDFEQIYKLIECIVQIFGSEVHDDTENYLDKIIDIGEIDVMSEFDTFFEGEEQLSNAQQSVEEELAKLDDEFLSSAPIIHQSPFTRLACERAPLLGDLVKNSKKNKKSEIKNPLYSRELIKTFYKWIAYLPLFTGVMFKYRERYASDSNSGAYDNRHGAGRVSNAPIESFFKILKHSILRKQTNLRPAEFLLKIHSTIDARMKANQHNVQQKRSRKRGRSTEKEVDSTCLIDEWKPKGTSRGTYFGKIIPVLTAGHIRNRLKEKLQMRQNKSFYDENDAADVPDDLLMDISLDEPIEHMEDSELENICESIHQSDIPAQLPSPIDHYETVSTNAHEINQMHFTSHSKENQSIAQATTDVLLNKGSNELDYRNETASEVSSNEIDEQNDEHDAVSDESYEVIDEPGHDTYQNKPEQFTNSFDTNVLRNDESSSLSYTTIDKLLISFPNYGVKSTFYNNQQYSVVNTCALDSSLFLLYYIYKSSSENFRSLFDQSIPVIDHLLITFDLVKTKGWDTARLYWITSHLNNSQSNNLDENLSLFSTADEYVFKYVKEAQSYIAASKCESTDCPKRVLGKHCTNISMPELNYGYVRAMNVVSFSEQYYTSCNATIGPDEPKSYDGYFYKDNKFPNRNGKGLCTMYICGCYRLTEPNEFTKVPPFLIVDVGRVKHDEKHNILTIPSVKALPFILTVGKQRYRLAGAICPENDHFTATIVRSKGRYSKFDDLWRFGVKYNEGGNDVVETAVYTLEMNN